MHIRLGLITGVVLGLAALVRIALLVVTVSGYSMTPTLTDGDRVLALRRRFGGRPRRNSIVVARSPNLATHELLIKRVIAVAGDPDPRVDGAGVIPPDTLFIVGDSNYGFDSSQFGPVPVESVLGIVVRRMSAR